MESAASVLGRWLEHRAADLARADRAVRDGAPEGVHDLRVACRRLGAGLTSYRRCFAGSETTRLGEELAWVVGEFGGARDLEVVRETFDAAAARAGVPDELRDSVDLRLADEERVAEAHAETALTSDRYAGVLDAVAALATDPSWSKRARRPAREVAAEVVRTEVRRVAVRAVATGDTGAGDAGADAGERSDALHRVRKAARRARYAAEVAAPVLRVDDLVAALTAMQEALGTHHDVAVAEIRLAGFDPSATARLTAELDAVAERAETAYRAALLRVLLAEVSR